MTDDCDDVLHERELRERWEAAHEHVHELEHEALKTALAAANQRLDEMNKLRAQIEQERGTYITRENFETVLSSVDTRLKLIENKGSNFEGRMWVIGAVVIIINVGIALSVFWAHR